MLLEMHSGQLCMKMSFYLKDSQLYLNIGHFVFNMKTVSGVCRAQCLLFINSTSPRVLHYPHSFYTAYFPRLLSRGQLLLITTDSFSFLPHQSMQLKHSDSLCTTLSVRNQLRCSDVLVYDAHLTVTFLTEKPHA